MKGNGEGRNRTADAEIFSLSLYRLSYLAIDAKNLILSIIFHNINVNRFLCVVLFLDKACESN